MNNKYDSIDLDDNTLVAEIGGVKKVFNILFSYHHDERNKDYVFIVEPENEDDVLVFSYDETTHELAEIEDDEEFSEVEEVFNAYLEDFPTE